jgi:ubiquinone/menaquinone biosynthesis C-methylase UbiE
MTGAGVFAAGVGAWWLFDSSPYPYAEWPRPERMVLDLTLPFLTNRRLDAVVGVRPGDRVLEIGPGTGLQALHIASQLGPSGRLDIVDIQQAMLDCVMRRADAKGIGGIVPTRADARELPFADASFDAAYLVCTLGEIPDPLAVLSEVRRVLKPMGNLVVGEFVDPHYVSLVTLKRYASERGFEIATCKGPRLAYLARLRPDGNLLSRPACPASRKRGAKSVATASQSVDS